MKQGFLTGTDPTEVWFRPADGKSISQSIARYSFGFVVLLLLAGGLGSYILFGWFAEQERADDRLLVTSLAFAPQTEQKDLLRESGREGVLVSSDGEVSVVLDVTRPSSTSAWHSSIRSGVGKIAEPGVVREFETKRAGNVWLHSATLTPTGDTLVIHRKASFANGLYLQVVGLGLAWLSLFAAGLAGPWWSMGLRSARSLQSLVQAADDLQFRGALRPTTRRRVQNISAKSREMKLLARSLEGLDEELTTTIHQLESLLRSAQTLGKSLNTKEVLDATLAMLAELMNVPRSAIFRVEADGETLSLIAAHGHSPEYLTDMTTRRNADTSPSMRSIEQGRPIQVSDAQSTFAPVDLCARAERYGYRSVMAVPFPSMASPVVLIVHKEEPYTYSYSETELIQTFVAIAAAALRNAQKFDSTDRSLDRQTSRLHAIVESVEDAILVVSSGDEIIFANQKMRSLLPSSGVFTDGMSAAEFFRLLLEASPDPTLAREGLEQLDGSQPWVELDIVDDEGVERTFRIRDFSAVDREDVIVGHGQVWTDVTEDRDLDRMKSGLLATVSHEFRTPLTLIKGYATTLLAEDVEWEAQDRSEFLELVATEADRLTELVKRLLDMRRIDAGLLDLQLLPVELDGIVSSAIAGTASCPASVRCRALPDVAVMADEPRLVTGLRNIIENARTHTRPGTEVTIGAEVDGSSVTIWICDRGPGVPERFRRQIFDSFFRTDSNLNSERSGIGLGLAIARGFIEAHHGKLWVGDGPNGEGSIFYVQIPLSPVLSSRPPNGTKPDRDDAPQPSRITKVADD